MNQLAKFVEALKPRFETSQKLATAIGMTLSAFSRGVTKGTLNVENLLRLATVAEESPSAVLELAGKKDVAQLIESLYGSPRSAISPAERDLLERWSRLPPDAKENLKGIIWRLTDERQTKARSA
jgi:hypothetical protein